MNVIELGPATAVAVLAAIVVFYLARAYLVAHGVPFRPVLIGAITVSYLFLFLLIETASAFGPGWLFVVNLLLVVLAAHVAFLVTFRSTRMERDHRGRWAYRSSRAVVLAWLVLLLLELYVQQASIGYIAILHSVVVRGGPFPIASTSVAIGPTARAALAIVDALFAVGTGLAIGRNAGLYLVFARARRTPQDPVAG
jgi:hypothetical protein